MSVTAASKFRSIRDFPELVDYLGDELDWPIETNDFEEMTFEYSAAELGLDEKTAPKFLEIRRLRPLDKDQPWGIFFIRFDDNKLPVVALRRLLSKLVLNKRSTSNAGDRASWHESDLLLISQTGKLGTQSISFAHFASNPEKIDLPILKVLGWDDDDTGLKIDYVIETLREKLVWPDDPTDSDAWRSQWRDAFTLKNREVIQSSKEMAERLGLLAVAVRTRLREVLAIESEEGPIHKLMAVFKENLISDLDTDSFSDMYAQTIAYGLLSARIINPKANTADAAHTQIPITNPFLRDLMETFLNVGGRSDSSGVGLDFDELGINEVVDLLDNTNMEAVLRDFGDGNQKEDPVMHFFEGFLKEYDSKIRKERGVFYTPQPVVSFIVRSVDEQLRTEFGLADGLADTTTWGEMVKRINTLEIPEGTSPDQAFVQILDPATGTGTFPVEVIDIIYKTMTVKWKSQGNREAQVKELWNDYVPKHLLPRLHGYELMMAPYAIAHMKIGLKLYETGYKFNSNERVRIYLTNSLEPSQDTSGTLAFAIPALANEAKAVNAIKNNMRFTSVLGNPPYSVMSGNLSERARGLVNRYRYVGNQKIQERSMLRLEMHLQDDYVKFLALSQQLLERTGIGLFGFITNNGFLDNLSLRGVRNSMFLQFESIFLLNLNGSRLRTRRHNIGIDENVFNIGQGVAVTIAWTKAENVRPKVSYKSILGNRKEKLKLLSSHSFQTFELSYLNPGNDQFFFVPRDTGLEKEYDAFESLDELMLENISGIVTAHDNLVVDFDDDRLIKNARILRDPLFSDETARTMLEVKDNSGWKLSVARQKMNNRENDTDYLKNYAYRPFDQRKIYYHPALIWSDRKRVMSHVLSGKNIALASCRQLASAPWSHIFVTRNLQDDCFISNRTRERSYHFPLLLNGSGYVNKNSTDLFKFDEDVPKNFSRHFLEKLKRLSNDESYFVDAEHGLFLIYAIMHSPAYRLRYEQFLSTGFPRLPVPASLYLYEQLLSYGRDLVTLHLLESQLPDEFNRFTVLPGTLRVERVSYSERTIWLDKNKTYGIKGVSENVWNFRVGCYQVCEKWLKDRGPKKGNSGRILTDDEIIHYQKIIYSISETIRIMVKIDEVINSHGGWPNAFIVDS